MRSFALAAVSLGILASQTAFAQSGPDGLYFRMVMAFGSFSQDHWWFLPDGRYLNMVPAEGLNTAGYDAACRKMPDLCGTYKVQGATLQLTPRKGPATSQGWKRRPDGNLELNGLFTRRVDKFEIGAKLDGHYSWVGGASGGGSSVSASRGYQFQPDGTYSTSSNAAVNAGYAGATASGSGSGTYKLSGNILELTSGGKTTAHVAYPLDMGKSGLRLNIDGEMFKRDR